MSGTKQGLIKHWREQAERHEKMSEAFKDKGDKNRQDTHTLIADTFRICADALMKV